MSVASSNPRTYGKRFGVKRKQVTEVSDSLKRRRVFVARTPSPAKTEDAATDFKDSTPVKPRVIMTYGAPSKEDLPTPSKGSKPVRDLSGIFDSISPSISPAGTPTKLAKRMLGRSRTESSVESHSSPREHHMDRTSSLPNLTSSPSMSTEPPVIAPRQNGPPSLPSTSSMQATTRTYAGKYRSFLVAIPASSSSTGIAHGLSNDEDFDARESYSSLRTRWGVDNSEDDPCPHEWSSPTKSTSTISDASPSRSGRGKGKARPPSIPTGMMNPLKSISELRNKGESRRFLDEVGYLFEGLDPKCGVGLRRASALEITTKLCDAEFTRKAKAADFFSRTWDLLLEAGGEKGDDKILDVLLVFFLALVARDSSSLLDLTERHTLPPSPSPSPKQGVEDSVVGILFRILAKDVDLLSLASNLPREGENFKAISLSKKDRITLISIYKTIASKSYLFPTGTAISTSLLITSILQSLPPSSILSTYLPTLLTSLHRRLMPIASFALHTVSPSELVKPLPYGCTYYHLRLLDTYLLGQWGSGGTFTEDLVDVTRADIEEHLNKARDEWIVDGLINLGVCTEQKGRNDGDDDVDDDDCSRQKCFHIALRVLISLTHADEKWGRKVLQCSSTMGLILRTIQNAGSELYTSEGHSTDGAMKREEQEFVKVEAGADHEPNDPGDAKDEDESDPGTHALDTLCLALGLLTNLVQVVDEAKEVVRRTRLTPACTFKTRGCIKKKCSCSSLKPSTGLEILISLYEQQVSVISGEDTKAVDQTEREAEAAFLRGHLAVLFGLLMMDSKENQTAILDTLPGSSLSSNLRLAIAKHAKLSKLVEQARDFVVFYTVVSKRLNYDRVDGGDEGNGEKVKESGVVKEVVSFLEGLRDDAS